MADQSRRAHGLQDHSSAQSGFASPLAESSKHGTQNKFGETATA